MRQRTPQAGFTLIEVMIAVLLTVIAVVGIVALYRTESRASSYSRRSTEATMLATDKLEKLRTLATATAGSESAIDAQGVAGGMFDRVWTVTVGTSYTDIAVRVGWDDDTTEATSCANDSTCTSKFCRPSSNKCASRAIVVYGRRNN
jgi:prepilin-type N-terminal cleavage/methylation domain-containing protein